MALRSGSRVDRGYSTVAEDEGVNYREIADVMCALGHTMNHSSARNHVIRVMKKFVAAFTTEWEIPMTEEHIDEIAKNPSFQHGVADLLHTIEAQRRASKV